MGRVGQAPPGPPPGLSLPRLLGPQEVGSPSSGQAPGMAALSQNRHQQQLWAKASGTGRTLGVSGGSPAAGGRPAP